MIFIFLFENGEWYEKKLRNIHFFKNIQFKPCTDTTGTNFKKSLTSRYKINLWYNINLRLCIIRQTQKTHIQTTNTKNNTKLDIHFLLRKKFFYRKPHEDPSNKLLNSFSNCLFQCRF